MKKLKNTGKITLYFILRVLVILFMLFELFFERDYYGAFTCILTLILLMIPTFVDKKLNIKLPSLLESIILLFIFSAQILGELQGFYLKVPYWDTILHTLNGFIMAGIGLAMIDILNRAPSLHFNMSPLFVVLVSFCFSMTIGVLWEFFEYQADCITYTDMQKDTLVHTISSVDLNPQNENVSYVVTDINETVIKGKLNGEPAEIKLDGYLDIGIHDTMADLAVNCIGAIVFSIFGIFYLKGRNKFALNFIPTLKSDKEKTE